jgi:Fe-S oxidoreductase/nitrate reductase gamma subunit
MIPTREIFWNIENARLLVHLLMLIPLFILIFGLLFHLNLYRLGRRGKEIRQITKRLVSLFLTVFTHRTILKDRYAGLMHLLIFGGFFVLLLGTFTVFFQDSILRPFSGLNLLYGNFYVLFKLILDLSGIAVVVGISMGIYRRYILKPSRLDRKPEDVCFFLLIFLIILSGFGLEGLRLSVTKPPQSLWSPVGFLFGSFFERMFEESGRLAFHRTLWWVHLGLGFLFIAYIPFSKLLHIFSSPFHIFVKSIDASVSLPPFDFRAERFGVNRIRDFSWESLLALDACTECGRCQDACPAHLSEKPLNPKKIILNLQKQMRKGSKFPYSKSGASNLTGMTLTEDEMWACTTCFNCVRKCPVFINPMEAILDLRRYQVLTESKIPPEIERVYRNLEWFGDSIGMGKIGRDELIRNATAEKKENNDPVELLFWVGCQGYFHERNRRTITSLFRLFEKLNVKFSILGREEICCGDIARRTGNEYLFKEIAEKNMEIFRQRKIAKIVTHCPHCFNVFKNEYPQLGGNFAVSHYTEFLAELFDKNPAEIRGDIVGKATFHDPCYLSRYNGIVSEPRALLGLIRGLDVAEMNQSKENTFCCGAGGGAMWLGRQIGKKMNEIRAEEAVTTNADYLVTACPYCLNMIEDGLKGSRNEAALRVLDIAELLDKAMG